MMIKCRTIKRFKNFLHFRAENTHLSAIGSDQLGGDVILQKWHKFLAHLSKVAFEYKKKKKACKNPMAYFFKLPRVGCHRHSAGKIENFENVQNIVK